MDGCCTYWDQFWGKTKLNNRTLFAFKLRLKFFFLIRISFHAINLPVLRPGFLSIELVSMDILHVFRFNERNQ